MSRFALHSFLNGTTALETTRLLSEKKYLGGSEENWGDKTRGMSYDRA